MLQRFQDFKDLSRCHHRSFPFLFKTIEIEYCFGPTKIIKCDLPKIPRFHAHQACSIPFQKYVGFYRIDLGFNDFRTSEIYHDSTVLFPRFYPKRSRLIWSNQTQCSILVPPSFPTFSKMSVSQMLRYAKKTCSRMI